MDFVVGRIPAVGGATERRPEPGAPIEARVLHVRQPRRSRNDASKIGQRRNGNAPLDPPGARVLVLLVPDAYKLPEDLMNGDYRIFLRIVRR